MDNIAGVIAGAQKAELTEDMRKYRALVKRIAEEPGCADAERTELVRLSRGFGLDSEQIQRDVQLVRDVRAMRRAHADELAAIESDHRPADTIETELAAATENKRVQLAALQAAEQALADELAVRRNAVKRAERTLSLIEQSESAMSAVFGGWWTKPKPRFGKSVNLGSLPDWW